MRHKLTLTDKCNKNCAFCYENATRQNISLSENLLYKQLDRILSSELNEHKFISFFGGEPFIELELMKKTIKVLKQYTLNNIANPIRLSFITNGILLNSPDVMSFLQQCKDDGFSPYIIISYDGIQNKIKNLGNNINRLITMLGKHSVRINYTLNKYNITDIVTNYKIAQVLGVKNIHYRPVHGDFVAEPYLLDIYKTNMFELFKYLQTVKEMPYELFPFIESWRVWNFNKKELNKYFYNQNQYTGCNIGLNSKTYSMDDETYYCHRLQFYQSYIKDVKDANKYMKEHNGTFVYKGCENCPTLKHCGLCSVLNEIYTGDRNTPHPILCKYYQISYELGDLFFKMFHPVFQEGYEQ